MTSRPFGGFTCLIAMDLAEDVVPSSLLRVFRMIAPNSDISIEENTIDGVVQGLICTIDRQTFGVAVIEGRMPVDVVTTASVSTFWQDSRASLDWHKGYLAVSAIEAPAYGADARLQATALTRLCAALAEVVPALAVLWVSAGSVSAPERLPRAVHEIAMGKWPIDVWISWRHYGGGDPDGEMLGLQTRGAAPFLGVEFDFPPGAVRDRKEPLRILFYTVGYLLDRGSVLDDGQVVEVRGERRTSFQLLSGDGDQPALARLKPLAANP